MAYRAIAFRKHEHVAAIGLGSLGSVESAGFAVEEFGELCAEIAWDEEVRVVTLTLDWRTLQLGGPGHPGLTETEQASLVDSAAKLKQPVIAAVKGDAIGLSLELAMACDMRIGMEGARFGLPQIREGLVPCAGGTQRLPRLVGRGKALEMLLTGDLIDATEALRIGLINRIAPLASLDRELADLAKEMAEKSPLAVGFVKEALHNGADLTLDQGLRMELDLYLLLFTTGDRVEGVTAFNEKRKPKFEGR